MIKGVGMMNEMSKKEKMDGRYPIPTRTAAEEQGSHPIRDQIQDIVQLAYTGSNHSPFPHHLPLGHSCGPFSSCSWTRS